MATIWDICVFLSPSAQRVSIFQDNVQREVSGSAFSRQKLKPICATRWVEKHDSIIIFVTLLPAVVSTLEELQQEKKQVEVATKAATLLNSVQKCTFLIAALVMQHTSGIILPFFENEIFLPKKRCLPNILSPLSFIQITIVKTFCICSHSFFEKQAF